MFAPTADKACGHGSREASFGMDNSFDPENSLNLAVEDRHAAGLEKPKAGGYNSPVVSHIFICRMPALNP
ncbi:hypothetical protein [Desulforhabdus sp. TSK]|uniref:hypothetical protein n=1 Tax=Desulforhabdus sp. TSK TaxID=2925014 RepID=UPI001FC7FD78|nr:hypothetical protein [Desulforhabdus sp. TSK]GKT07332.1 hypothetical protein DSTSK_06370 [Desulforhabdus sp. TSK]